MNHTAQIDQLAVSRNLRRTIIAVILVVFSASLVLLAAVNFLFIRQNQVTETLFTRYQQLSDIQSLTALQLREDQAIESHLINRTTIDELKHDDFEALLRATQQHLLSLPPVESPYIDQELRLADNLLRTHERIRALVVTPTGTNASPETIRQNIKDLSDESSRFFTSWRLLIRDDINRLKELLQFYNQLRLATLAGLALVAILSLVMTAYTSILPSFERILRKVLEQNQQLRQVDKLKTEFLSIASHQLKTPLAALKWSLALLDRQSTDFATSQRHFLEDAKTNTTIMVKLVTNFLNISRIEQGRLQFEPKLVNVLPLVRAACADIHKIAHVRLVNLKIATTNEKIMVIADPLLLKQVIQNLIDNAVHYNRKGGTVTIKVSPHSNQWRIDVTDTGYGIPPEDTKKVFTKFFRSAAALEMRPDGSGLGLFFVKKIVEKHKGRIWLISKVNKGTTVSFTLPKA